MKRTISAILILVLIADTAAQAGTPPHWTQQGIHVSGRAAHDRGERREFRDPRADRQFDRGRSNYRDYPRERYRAGRYYPPRGYVANRWYRGDRLPRAYFARPYVVYGYRSYHLYDPPRGYCWVRVSNDVFLTAIATGIVLDAVYNMYY